MMPRPMRCWWRQEGWIAATPRATRRHQVRQRQRDTTLLPKPPSGYERLVDPSDSRQSLEARARSYLHANCSQCHVEAGGGNAMIELEFSTPRKKMNVISVRPLHHTFD